MMRFPSKKGTLANANATTSSGNDRMYLSESSSSSSFTTNNLGNNNNSTHSPAFTAAISDAKIDFQGSSLLVRDAELVRKVVNYLSSPLSSGSANAGDDDRLLRQQYEAQISALNKELDRRSQSLRLLEQKIREITAASEAEITLLRQELEREVEAGRQENQLLKIQVQELLRAQSSTVSPELQQELTVARVQLESANQQLAVNREEMERLRQHVARAQGEFAKCNNDLNQSNMQLARANADLSHAQAEVARQQGDVARHQQEIARQQGEVQQLKQDIAAKESVIQNRCTALTTAQKVSAMPTPTLTPQPTPFIPPVQHNLAQPTPTQPIATPVQQGGDRLPTTVGSRRRHDIPAVEPEPPVVRNIAGRLQAEQSAGASMLEEKQRKKEEMERLKKEIMMEMRKEVELEMQKYGTVFGEKVAAPANANANANANSNNKQVNAANTGNATANEPPRRRGPRIPYAQPPPPQPSAEEKEEEVEAEEVEEEQPLPVRPGKSRPPIPINGPAAAAANTEKGAKQVANAVPTALAAKTAAPKTQTPQTQKKNDKPAAPSTSKSSPFVFDVAMLSGPNAAALPSGKKEVKSLDMLKAVCKAKNSVKAALQKQGAKVEQEQHDEETEKEQEGP